MKKLIFTVFLIFTSLIINAQDTIHVPADYTTIQAGINAANNGDLVLVEDGTYIENINYRGKAITVASHFIVDGDTNHISNTIIDGSQPSNPDSGSVVTFNSGEDTTSVLCGFTITGGTGTYYPPQPPMPDSRIGGGIICHLSGARICHNKITSNVLTLNMGIVAGGGISVVPPGNTSWIILKKNTIVNNSIKGLFGGGGGAQLIANAKVLYNIIEYNTGDCTGENIWGGGLAMGSGEPNVTIPYERYIIGNTIRFNKVLATGNGKGFGGGLAVYTSPKAIIKYNNISYNEVQSSAALNKKCYGGGVMLQNQNEETEFVNNYVALNKALPNSICRGAGIALWGFAIPCSPYLYNNIITDNTNGTHGGGIFIGGLYVSEAKLFNNTFAQNSADYGGAVYSAQSNPLISNSILWNNGTEIYLDGGTVTVEYSDVEGGWT